MPETYYLTTQELEKLGEGESVYIVTRDFKDIIISPCCCDDCLVGKEHKVLVS